MNKNILEIEYQKELKKANDRIIKLEMDKAELQTRFDILVEISEYLLKKV